MIVFQVSRWNDLLQAISNPDNGLKSKVAEVIQFKKHLFKHVLCAKCYGDKENNITFLPLRTSQSRQRGHAHKYHDAEYDKKYCE